MTAPPFPPSPAPLVGRDRELATLRAALDAALAGRGSLVLIGGEAGIGKTTLAEAVLAEAQERGALVLIGRCYDLSETPPYGPWAEALARLPGAGEDGALPSPLGPGDSVGSQTALFARTRQALNDAAGCTPLLVLLEDLHWADSGSLDLLRFIGRQLGALPLFILATYRDDEIAEGQAWATSLPTLVREARAARLTPPRLTAEHARDLARARYRLPLADEDRLAAHLQAHAEGNPFYLSELLRSLEEEGVLHSSGGDAAWALGDLAGVRVPPLLRQVIGARVARLGAEAGRLLAVAAVVGQAVPLDLWAAVSEAGNEVLAEVVGSAVAARVLVETPDGHGVRFAHALVRDALYEAAPLPRRRALHRRAAEALIALPAPDPDAVAGHLQRAGDPRALGWLAEAGLRALRSCANRTAAARYEAALALVPDNQADPGTRGWLLVRLAATRYIDDPHEGIGYLEEAAQLAAVADDRALAAYARFRLGFHLTGVGDYRRGLPALESGVAELVALSPAEQPPLVGLESRGADYTSTFAYRLALVGRFADARHWTDEAIMRGSGRTAHFARAEVYAASGQFAAAQAEDACGHAMIRGRSDWLVLGFFVWYELHSKVMVFAADDLAERRRLAETAATALARGSGLQGEENPQLGYLPLLAIEGRWDEACAAAQGVVAGRRNYRPPIASLLARLTHLRGDDATGIALTQEALPQGPDEAPGFAYYYPALELQRLAVDRALAAGDLPLARAWLVAHDRWLTWSGTVLGRAEGQLGWAKYHRAMGDPVAAHDHATRALAHATEPRQPLALLAAHRLLGELATGVGQINDARMHLDAALALADACAAPYERALTLLALAELHVIAGDRDTASMALDDASAILARLQARPALARCAALAARLSAAAPAALHVIPAAPAGLTAREVEVLRLVAAGRSNREMAAALSRSERTIERHLENIYRKIAARNRADATAFALRHHLA